MSDSDFFDRDHCACRFCGRENRWRLGDEDNEQEKAAFFAHFKQGAASPETLHRWARELDRLADAEPFRLDPKNVDGFVETHIEDLLAYAADIQLEDADFMHHDDLHHFLAHESSFDYARILQAKRFKVRALNKAKALRATNPAYRDLWEQERPGEKRPQPQRPRPINACPRCFEKPGTEPETNDRCLTCAGRGFIGDVPIFAGDRHPSSLEERPPAGEDSHDDLEILGDSEE